MATTSNTWNSRPHRLLSEQCLGVYRGVLPGSTPEQNPIVHIPSLPPSVADPTQSDWVCQCHLDTTKGSQGFPCGGHISSIPQPYGDVQGAAPTHTDRLLSHRGCGHCYHKKALDMRQCSWKETKEMAKVALQWENCTESEQAQGTRESLDMQQTIHHKGKP